MPSTSIAPALPRCYSGPRGARHEKARTRCVSHAPRGAAPRADQRSLSHRRRHGGEPRAVPRPDRSRLAEGNRNLLLRIRDRERKLISKIDEALGRIEDGSYGKCEDCGADIGLERLKARPVTTLCIDCKSLQEAQERKLRTT